MIKYPYTNKPISGTCKDDLMTALYKGLSKIIPEMITHFYLDNIYTTNGVVYQDPTKGLIMHHSGPWDGIGYTSIELSDPDLVKKIIAAIQGPRSQEYLQRDP